MSRTALDASAILFDLDGVLVDSTACIERHWRRWALEHGLDPADVLRVAHGRRAVETLAIIAPSLDAAGDAAALETAESTDLDGVSEIPGAASLLAALPPDAWAVVTSGTRAVATARLRHVGLRVPAALITADDVREGKPSPEGYLAAAGALGAMPTECVVIEDTPAGIAAAGASGMRSIAVTTTYPRVELSAATHVVDRLDAMRVEANLELSAGLASDRRVRIILPD